MPHAYVADGHHRSASAWRADRRREPATRSIGATRSTTGFSRSCFRPTSSPSCPTIGWCGTWAAKRVRRCSRRCAGRDGCHPPTRRPRPPESGNVLRLSRRCAGFGSSWTSRLDRSPGSDRLAGRFVAAGSGPRPRSSASATLVTDKRLDFVGGIRGTVELERRVDLGRDGDCVLAVSDHHGPVDGGVRRGDHHAAEEHLVRAQAA